MESEVKQELPVLPPRLPGSAFCAEPTCERVISGNKIWCAEHAGDRQNVAVRGVPA